MPPTVQAARTAQQTSRAAAPAGKAARKRKRKPHVQQRFKVEGVPVVVNAAVPQQDADPLLRQLKDCFDDKTPSVDSLQRCSNDDACAVLLALSRAHDPLEQPSPAFLELYAHLAAALLTTLPAHVRFLETHALCVATRACAAMAASVHDESPAAHPALAADARTSDHCLETALLPELRRRLRAQGTRKAVRTVREYVAAAGALAALPPRFAPALRTPIRQWQSHPAAPDFAHHMRFQQIAELVTYMGQEPALVSPHGQHFKTLMQHWASLVAGGAPPLAAAAACEVLQALARVRAARADVWAFTFYSNARGVSLFRGRLGSALIAAFEDEDALAALPLHALHGAAQGVHAIQLHDAPLRTTLLNAAVRFAPQIKPRAALDLFRLVSPHETKSWRLEAFGVPVEHLRVLVAAATAAPPDAAPLWAPHELWAIARVLLSETGLPEGERNAALEALAAQTDWQDGEGSREQAAGGMRSERLTHRSQRLARVLVQLFWSRAPRPLVVAMLEFAARQPAKLFHTMYDWQLRIALRVCMHAGYRNAPFTQMLLEQATQLATVGSDMTYAIYAAAKLGDFARVQRLLPLAHKHTARGANMLSCCNALWGAAVAAKAVAVDAAAVRAFQRRVKSLLVTTRVCELSGAAALGPRHFQDRIPEDRPEGPAHDALAEALPREAQARLEQDISELFAAPGSERLAGSNAPAHGSASPLEQSQVWEATWDRSGGAWADASGPAGIAWAARFEGDAVEHANGAAPLHAHVESWRGAAQVVQPGGPGVAGAPRYDHKAPKQQHSTAYDAETHDAQAADNIYASVDWGQAYGRAAQEQPSADHSTHAVGHGDATLATHNAWLGQEEAASAAAAPSSDPRAAQLNDWDAAAAAWAQSEQQQGGVAEPWLVAGDVDDAVHGDGVCAASNECGQTGAIGSREPQEAASAAHVDSQHVASEAYVAQAGAVGAVASHDAQGAYDAEDGIIYDFAQAPVAAAEAANEQVQQDGWAAGAEGEWAYQQQLYAYNATLDVEGCAAPTEVDSAQASVAAAASSASEAATTGRRGASEAWSDSIGGAGPLMRPQVRTELILGSSAADSADIARAAQDTAMRAWLLPCIAWAVAALHGAGHEVEEGVVSFIIDNIETDKMNPIDYTNVLHAAEATGVAVQAAQPFILALVHALSQSLDAWTVKELATVAYCLGRYGIDPGGAVLAGIGARLAAAQDAAPLMHLCNGYTGLYYLGHMPPSGAARGLEARVLRNVAEAAPDDLSQVLLLCTRLGHAPVALLATLEGGAPAALTPLLCSPDACVKLCMCIATFGTRHARLFAAAMLALSYVPREAFDFSEDVCLQICQAYHTMRAYGHCAPRAPDVVHSRSLALMNRAAEKADAEHRKLKTQVRAALRSLHPDLARAELNARAPHGPPVHVGVLLPGMRTPSGHPVAIELLGTRAMSSNTREAFGQWLMRRRQLAAGGCCAIGVPVDTFGTAGHAMRQSMLRQALRECGCDVPVGRGSARAVAA